MPQKPVDVVAGLGRPVAYYPNLVPVLGGAKETLLFCQLMYWTFAAKRLGGWVYKTREELQVETGLTRSEQETARKHLKERGFLEEEQRGVHGKLHFRINVERLNDALSVLAAEDNLSDVLAETLQSETSNVSEGTSLGGIPANYLAGNLPSTLRDSCQHKTETTAETTAARDVALRTTTRGSGALDRPSKHATTSRPVSIDDAVTSAAEKSRTARARKDSKPRNVQRNATTATKHFAEKFTETFGGIAPLELAKDRSLMKKMVDHYGYDTTIQYMDWMFRHWAQFRRECRITGVPTVGVFFGFRGYLQEHAGVVESEKSVDNAWGV